MEGFKSRERKKEEGKKREQPLHVIYILKIHNKETYNKKLIP